MRDLKKYKIKTLAFLVKVSAGRHVLNVKALGCKGVSMRSEKIQINSG